MLLNAVMLKQLLTAAEDNESIDRMRLSSFDIINNKR